MQRAHSIGLGGNAAVPTAGSLTRQEYWLLSPLDQSGKPDIPCLALVTSTVKWAEVVNHETTTLVVSIDSNFRNTYINIASFRTP